MKIYAVYKGEECLAIGTAKEIAKQLKVKVETVWFYMTPAYQKRGAKKNANRRILIRLDD